MPKNVMIFDTLKQEHRKVKSQFEELLSASERAQSIDTIDLRMLSDLRKELALHMALEEQFLYPRAEKIPQVSQVAQDAYNEHREIREILNGIRQASDPMAVSDALRRILQIVEHHVREEENQIFPAMENNLDEASLQKLDQTMGEARRRELAKM
ncbi:MAG TPA: hemerythrin domain-containing protein [Coleofasciculaceae cyanobacterium]|jgi:hemerythrin superfamily protein